MSLAHKERQGLLLLKQIAGDVLHKRLGGRGLHNIQVATGEDHDGDEIIYIDAYFDLTDPLDPSLFYHLTSRLREALQRQGEYRFPHLRYHFHNQQ